MNRLFYSCRGVEDHVRHLERNDVTYLKRTHESTTFVHESDVLTVTTYTFTPSLFLFECVLLCLFVTLNKISSSSS